MAGNENWENYHHTLMVIINISMHLDILILKQPISSEGKERDWSWSDCSSSYKASAE